jgi:DnaJ-class molecular chaperone
MPLHNSHKKFGNLIVTYQVKFPKQLDEGQKVQVKKLFEGAF